MDKFRKIKNKISAKELKKWENFEQLYRDLYSHRCKDMGVRPCRDDAEEWVEKIKKSKAITDTKIVLNYEHLGPLSMIPLMKIVSLYGPTLQALILRGNGIADEGFSKLSDYFFTSNANQQTVSIKKLDLCANDFTDRSALILESLLSTNNSITSLNLSSDRQKKLKSNKGDNVLLSRTNWHPNRLTSIAAMSIAKGLRLNKTLTSLNLQGNRLGNGDCNGVESLGKSLEKNGTLNHLCIGGNMLGHCGIFIVQSLFSPITQLNTLDLQHNEFEHEIGFVLAKALESTKTLTNLNISKNFLGAKGIKSLSIGLRASESLILLDISENDISDSGAFAIADALIENKTLTGLYLRNNNIGQDGIIAIANAMEKHQVLNTLNIAQNTVGDEGSIALAKQLEKDESLCELNLTSTKVTSRGIQIITEALQLNRTLETLKIGDNFLNDTCANEVIRNLLNNHTLVDLNLKGNQLSHIYSLEIQQICKRNEKDAKHMSAVPIRAEIEILRMQVTRIPFVAEEIEQVKAEIASTSNSIIGKQAELVDLQQQIETEKKSNAIKSKEIEDNLKTQMSSLKEKEDELEHMRSEYELKIGEVSESLKREEEISKGYHSQITELEGTMKAMQEKYEKSSSEKKEQIEEIQKETQKISNIVEEIQKEVKEIKKFKQSDKLKAVGSSSSIMIAKTQSTIKVKTSKKKSSKQSNQNIDLNVENEEEKPNQTEIDQNSSEEDENLTLESLLQKKSKRKQEHSSVLEATEKKNSNLYIDGPE